MSDTATNTPAQPPRQKQRHGFLTTYLIIMIIANSASALSYLIAAEGIRRKIPTIPEWAFPVLIVGAILNVVFVIAVWNWKKWGFLGLVAVAVSVFLVNISVGLALESALLGLLGPAILYGVLHIGKWNKGWPQLDWS